MSNSARRDEPPLMLGGLQVGTENLRPTKQSPTSRPVVVTDIQMPFVRMVEFSMKWALASIPALIVLAFVGGLVSELLRARLR